MTITAFPSSGRLGPGAAPAFQGTVIGSGAPYLFVVTLRDALSADVLYSRAINTSGLFATVYLGFYWDYVANTFEPQPIIQTAGLVDGAAIEFRVQIKGSNGVQTEIATLTGFSWDAQSWGVNQAYIQSLSGGGHDPMLDEILASVKRTYS